MNTSTPASDEGQPTRRRNLKRAILIGLGMFLVCEVVATLLYQQYIHPSPVDLKYLNL